MQAFTVRFVGLIALLLLTACGGQSGPIRPAATQPAGQDALLSAPDGAGRPLDGVIRSIDGDSLVIERMGGLAVTVTLDAATQLRRQMSARVSDLAVGLEVTVLIILPGRWRSAPQGHTFPTLASL